MSKKYLSPDLEACRESADGIFKLCDDFIEKMKKYEELEKNTRCHYE